MRNLRNLKITIEYDGSAFFGWQRVKDGPSVQAALENAVKAMTGEDVQVLGSGRTDRDVHALGQVANFQTESDLPLYKFLGALNAHTPESIAITQVAEVEEDFHARFTATARRYKFLIYNRKQMNPLWVNRASLVRVDLDIEAMEKALALVPRGEGDWSSFRTSICQSPTPWVDLQDLQFYKVDDHMWALEIQANHFLHNMIRILTGTLVDIGHGKFAPEDLTRIFEAKDRTQAGQTLAGDGLYFMEAIYPEHKVLDSYTLKEKTEG